MFENQGVNRVKAKKLHLELLRIVACFFVIFNHTDDRGYLLFAAYPVQSAEYWIYLFVSVFCKMSVPMFFAISGALLIDREETLPELFKKRIFKTVVLLLLFSLLYYVLSLEHISDFSPYMFFGTMYTYTWNFSFWYLYSYIAFLLCLPFVRALAKNLKNEQFFYLFGCVLLFGSLLPIAEHLVWRGEHTLYPAFNITWITAQILVYPCLGYFIEKRLDIRKAKKWLLPMWIINIAGILLSGFMTYFNAGITGAYSEKFFSSFVLINTSTLFISAKYLMAKRAEKPKSKVQERSNRLISTLGGCTLGIYLLHVYFLFNLPFTNTFWTFLDTSLGVNPMLSALIVCFAVFAVCCIITMLLKKIPLLNRLI